MKKSIPKILLIEDNTGDVELIRAMLDNFKSKFSLERSDRLSSGLKLLEEESFDVVLLDLGLPDSSGIDTLLKVQEKKQAPPIIVLTGLSDEELAEEAIWFGAQDYLVKGKIDDDMLYRSIIYSIKRRQAEEALRAMEEQLRQAQKMEAIGQISGGIAHDFNNILSAMMGYVTLIQMKSKEGDPARYYLDQLLSLTERASTLTKSLLAFSRKQILDIKPTSLNNIVSTIGKLLFRVIGEDIKLDLKLSDRDMVVNADAGQIEQALMNLATNARDAMHEGGTLTISTGPLEMDDNFIKMHGYGKPGKYAFLIVEDTGMGIDEKTRKKIFEPFFTTKGVEKGTGLGLAMVYGTIKQHDGYINVYSEVGKGTTFKIYLPAIDTEAAEVKSRDNIPTRGGTETILLAEDEASLRQATSSMLEEFGYKVIEAEDGNDAVNKFAEHKAEIELVLMDVVMPRKSGKEAYQEMQKMRPDVKVIFTSGHTGEILTSKKIAEEGLQFIAKPVAPRELFEKIRDMLDN